MNTQKTTRNVFLLCFLLLVTLGKHTLVECRVVRLKTGQQHLSSGPPSESGPPTNFGVQEAKKEDWKKFAVQAAGKWEGKTLQKQIKILIGDCSVASGEGLLVHAVSKMKNESDTEDNKKLLCSRITETITKAWKDSVEQDGMMDPDTCRKNKPWGGATKHAVEVLSTLKVNPRLDLETVLGVSDCPNGGDLKQAATETAATLTQLGNCKKDETCIKEAIGNKDYIASWDDWMWGEKKAWNYVLNGQGGQAGEKEEQLFSLAVIRVCWAINAALRDDCEKNVANKKGTKREGANYVPDPYMCSAMNAKLGKFAYEISKDLAALAAVIMPNSPASVAAKKIQAVARGNAARANKAKTATAATKIQAVARGNAARANKAKTAAAATTNNEAVARGNAANKGG